MSCESHGGVPQDPEEHGGGLGAGDHPVPQRLRRQPGDALLPLAALAQLPAVRPRPAPHPAQHDEEGLPAVSNIMKVLVTHPAQHEEEGLPAVSNIMKVLVTHPEPHDDEGLVPLH